MSNTPRTDEAREKTLTPAYEYEGAEGEAWEFARKLERELAFAKNAVLEIREWTPERWADICTIARPAALWISGEQMNRLMELANAPRY
jgi:hypothetical protein